jgi:hypothetical protein
MRKRPHIFDSTGHTIAGGHNAPAAPYVGKDCSGHTYVLGDLLCLLGIVFSLEAGVSDHKSGCVACAVSYVAGRRYIDWVLLDRSGGVAVSGKAETSKRLNTANPVLSALNFSVLSVRRVRPNTTSGSRRN